jgi:hypothetical protein
VVLNMLLGPRCWIFFISWSLKLYVHHKS